MSRFDPYYEWLGIPESDQPANHYRLLSIPMYEMNIEVIKSASERQTIFLRTLQAGEHASAAAQMLNEVAAARVCLLDVQQKEAYDIQMRFAQPVQPQIPRPLPTTVNPALPVPHTVPSSDPQNAAVMVHQSKVQPTSVTPVWQRPSVMVPAALVGVTVVILLVLFSLVNDDTPFTPPPASTGRQPVNGGPPVAVVKPESVVRPLTVAPAESPVPDISADDTARFIAALKSARVFQVQRKLSAAAAHLKIAKPLGAIPQYSSEFTRTEFLQQLLEQFKRLTIIAIDSYIPGSEIVVGTSNIAIVVEVSPSTLTVKVNGEVKEYLRDDLVLEVAMGIAATSFEDGPMKGFIQAAYLLTFPDRQDSYLVRARELWEVGDANLAPAGLFDKYLSDFDDVDVPKLLAKNQNSPTDNMRHEEPIISLPTVYNSIGMQLVRVPSGRFMMGSPDSESGRDNNETEHLVTISHDYFMQTTEVTQSQWKSLMGTEPWKGKEYVKEGASYPAVYVSWDEAVAYCKRLSAKEGKTYRLPTEAEWEYACRAGTKTTWSFGDDEASLGDYAWYRENAYGIGERYAHQVGMKKPNAFGLYDIHGNVFEWCLDYYGENYYRTSPEKKPSGPASGDFRVLRGGSWAYSTRDSRSALRRASEFDLVSDHVGFRLVYEISVDDAQLTSDGNSGPSMIPVVEELDLLKLATTMNNVREALEVRDMETATTELKKVQSLPISPEFTAVVLRLAKMTELLNEFIKNSEAAIDGMVPGSEIMVAGSTIVSVERVSQTELVIKVGGRLRTYSRNQLSVAIAMGIADTCFQDNEYTTSLKAAFVATQKKPNVADITKAKGWWESGPELIETFNLYLVDRYDFQDGNAIAETPDNPLVFTIDLVEASPSYNLSIPYEGNVEASNISVQFDVTARGTQAFSSETDQNEPVAINKGFNAEIMLGQHVQPAVGKAPAKIFNLVGDVLARLSYDAKKQEFRIYVKPTADVGAGKQNSTEVGLSAQLSEKRVEELQRTIDRTKQEINILYPANMTQLLTLYQQLDGQRAVAANSNTVDGALLAANLAAQMNQVQAKHKVQSGLQISKRNRLPAFHFNLAYLKSLTLNLANLKHLDIRYRIYQKMDDKNVLIIDGW